MKKIFLILAIFAILRCESKPQQSTVPIDDLIDQIFNGTPNPSPESKFEGPTYAPCGNEMICVPFYNCRNDTGTLNTDGENLIDIRIDDTKPCTSYLETCCSLQNTAKEPTGPTTPRPAYDYHDKCGTRNVDGIGFKISGNFANETEYGEFPWMMAILKQEQIDMDIINIYQCGGSLIHPQVVLTAAHCVYKNSPNELIVRAGEWDTQTKEEIYREQDLPVIEIVLHDKFSKGGLHNDIALLLTAAPFSLGADVSTLCLPPPKMNFDGSRCVATGWGKDKFGLEGNYQVIMKKIDLPIVPNDVCQAKLRTTRLGKFFQLHESFICAGGEIGKDTCRGDGGGPLACPIPGHRNRYYQTGIVAWGIDCGGENPGVYGSVPYLREWVDNILASRNFDPAYYTAK